LHDAKDGTYVEQALPGNRSLQEADPEIYNLIQEEKHRQVHGLEMIASEVTRLILHDCNSL
jgi:glycine/serine hydroxymethyltransferase